MIDLKNVLHVVNEIIVLPTVIVAFLLLMYIVVFLNKKDPDVVRAKIFLNYNRFKKAFLLLAVLAFILIFHVALIYFQRFFLIEDYFLVKDLQLFFGLTLAIVMISFVSLLYKCMK